MKKLLAFSALAILPLTMTGASGLTATCVDGVVGWGNCYPGHVRFTGTDYPAAIHVTVTNTGNNGIHDDFDYDASAGVDFTESLYPPGRYRVDITSAMGYAETKYVYTGSWDHHDDN